MITVKNISKSYFGNKVLDRVSFEVPTGGIFGFLGVNGAGKTTTLKIIVGLARPDSGEVFMGDKPMERAFRERMGFMPEGPYFYENLTGYEFLVLCGGLFSGTSDKAEAHYRGLLSGAGLASAGDRRIWTYSKGMRQRLGFAQALVNDPDYIFLDEPLDGLDPIGRREIKRIITGLKDKGKTIFLNSHILSDIEEMCDRIGIIHAGRLLYTGPVKEFCSGTPLEEKFVQIVSAQKNPLPDTL